MEYAISSPDLLDGDLSRSPVQRVYGVLRLLNQVAGGLGSAAILAWLLPYFEMSCVGFYEAVKVPVYSEPPDMNL